MWADCGMFAIDNRGQETGCVTDGPVSHWSKTDKVTQFSVVQIRPCFTKLAYCSLYELLSKHSLYELPGRIAR